MTKLIKLFGIFSAIAFSLALVSCGGEAEKEADNAGEKAKEEVKEAAEAVGDAVKEKAGEVGDAAKKTINEAAKKVEEATQ